MCKNKSGRIFRVILWVCSWISQSRPMHMLVLCLSSSSLWSNGQALQTVLGVGNSLYKGSLWLHLLVESCRAEICPLWFNSMEFHQDAWGQMEGSLCLPTYLCRQDVQDSLLSMDQFFSRKLSVNQCQEKQEQAVAHHCHAVLICLFFPKGQSRRAIKRSGGTGKMWQLQWDSRTCL